MTKKILFIICIFITAKGFSQRDSVSNYFKGTCYHYIDGSGFAEGLKMNFLAPCQWDSLDEKLPYVVREFGYNLGDGGLLASLVTVMKIKFKHTTEEDKAIYAKAFYNKSKFGEVLSIRKVNIDALQWAEVRTQRDIEMPYGKSCQRSLFYMTIYKDWMISIMFKVSEKDNGALADLLYVQYEPLFKSLASGLRIYNHWNY